jgi:hypothetical protein
MYIRLNIIRIAVNDRYSWGLLTLMEIRHALSNRTFYTFRASYNVDDTKRYLFPLLDANGNEAGLLCR